MLSEAGVYGRYVGKRVKCIFEAFYNLNFTRKNLYLMLEVLKQELFLISGSLHVLGLDSANSLQSDILIG